MPCAGARPFLAFGAACVRFALDVTGEKMVEYSHEYKVQLGIVPDER